jgi:hypothetical protein
VSSGLSLLPNDIAEKSLSKKEIVLPISEAERAVEHLVSSGQQLESWEGWVQFSDGGRTKSLRHPGAFVLPRDRERAGKVTLEGMRKAQEVWNRAPEYPGARLFFCIMVTD